MTNKQQLKEFVKAIRYINFYNEPCHDLMDMITYGVCPYDVGLTIPATPNFCGCNACPFGDIQSYKERKRLYKKCWMQLLSPYLRKDD